MVALTSSKPVAMASSSLEPGVDLRVRGGNRPSPRFQRVVSFEESDLPSTRTTAGVSPERVAEEEQDSGSLTGHEIGLRKLEVHALVAEKKVAEGCAIATELGRELMAVNRLDEACDLLSTALCIQVRPRDHAKAAPRRRLVGAGQGLGTGARPKRRPFGWRRHDATLRRRNALVT